MYDADYFERGVETGKSLYSNYRWIPELTIPLAYRLIRLLGIYQTDRVLDFGCAKGFLVKAFRLLGIKAHGYDISEYAISRAPADVAKYLSLDKRKFRDKFDFIIAKDVFEHLTEQQLDEEIHWAARKTRKLFVTVPLGDGERYHIPAYNQDKTHVLKEDMKWWHEKLLKRFRVVVDSYDCSAVKGNWVKVNRFGNASFVCWH